MSVFLISLPVFLIILSGFVFKKYDVIKNDWIYALNSFAYYVSLPAFMVAILWGVDFLDRSLWGLIFAGLAITILFSSLVFVALLFFKLSHSKKVAIFLTATVGNTIYMGLPLVELGFGKESLAGGAIISIVFLIIPLLIAIFIIKYWHDRNHGILSQLFLFIKNPLVISVIIGFFLSFLKIEFPAAEAAKKFFLILGATASPVALFALGGFLQGRFLKENMRLSLIASIIKTIVFPFFVVFVASFFIKTINFGIFILLASMPVAATAFVIAEKFKIEENLVGDSILISIIISFFVAPLIIFLF